ncbi:hypothetical protein C8J56DRAFT_203049 [Mycena floridula]|nr:hypothetical protein C8J56DRAFT_203049 [Mycena floridula]
MRTPAFAPFTGLLLLLHLWITHALALSISFPETSVSVGASVNYTWAISGRNKTDAALTFFAVKARLNSAVAHSGTYELILIPDPHDSDHTGEMTMPFPPPLQDGIYVLDAIVPDPTNSKTGLLILSSSTTVTASLCGISPTDSSNRSPSSTITNQSPSTTVTALSLGLSQAAITIDSSSQSPSRTITNQSSSTAITALPLGLSQAAISTDSSSQSPSTTITALPLGLSQPAITTGSSNHQPSTIITALPVGAAIITNSSNQSPSSTITNQSPSSTITALPLRLSQAAIITDRYTHLTRLNDKSFIISQLESVSVRYHHESVSFHYHHGFTLRTFTPSNYRWECLRRRHFPAFIDWGPCSPGTSKTSFKWNPDNMIMVNDPKSDKVKADRSELTTGPYDLSMKMTMEQEKAGSPVMFMTPKTKRQMQLRNNELTERVAQLEVENSRLRAEVQWLRDHQESDWARGLTDEIPPSYLDAQSGLPHS